jgi:ketosteroid isomerase-like protein
MKHLVTATAFLCLIACGKTTNQTAMQPTPELQSAVAALRTAYAAFNCGDIDSAILPFDPQIEWTEPPEFSDGSTYHGVQAVKGYLTQSRSGWAEGASEPEQFIPAGNRIVVFVRARFRLKGTDQWQDISLADVYTFRNGKAISMRAFASREAALRWAAAEARLH